MQEYGLVGWRLECLHVTWWLSRFLDRGTSLQSLIHSKLSFHHNLRVSSCDMKWPMFPLDSLALRRLLLLNITQSKASCGYVLHQKGTWERTHHGSVMGSIYHERPPSHTSKVSISRQRQSHSINWSTEPFRPGLSTKNFSKLEIEYSSYQNENLVDICIPSHQMKISEPYPSVSRGSRLLNL